MKGNKRINFICIVPFALWAAIFVITPLFIILAYGFTDDNWKFTLDNILTITKHGYFSSLMISIALALVCTVICLLIAYPVCLFLAEMDSDTSGFMLLLFVLPMWVNSLLTMMAWQSILEKSGIINTFLQFLGLSKLRLINTNGAIVLGMVYVYLPYMILPIYTSLVKIDASLKDAASDLGADPLHVFTHVTLPLSRPGIMSGITMVFIPALTTFVISAMLGGGKVMLIGNIIDQLFTSGYDWHLGSGLSIVLLVFIVLNMLLQHAVNRS